MKKDNTNSTTVILNLFRNLNKGIRKKEQGNKFVTEDITRHPEGDSPKDLQTLGSRFFAFAQNDVTGSLAPCGRGVGRGENPLQNDVTTCAPLEREPKSLISRRGKNTLDCNQKPSPEFVSNKNKLDCFAFARNDAMAKFEGNKILKQSWIIGGSAGSTQPSPGRASLLPKSAVQHVNTEIVQNNIKDKNRNELINLSTYRLIDLKKNAAFTLAEGATHVDLPPTKAKLAFTLAEVLITLGIIGVVAAITIPGLINHYKAQRLRTQFLESYSIVQQVFKQMEADDVSLDPTTYPTGQFYKTFMKYLKGATDCNRKKFLPCYYFNTNNTADENYAPYKSLDGKTNVPGNNFDDGQIALNNGMLIMFENYSNDLKGGDANRLWVSVDINGYNNPPNRWGYDLFTFQFLDGELRTMGDKETAYTNMNAYCNPKTTNWLNGIACASKAKTDTDYFKNIVKTVK